MNKIRKNVPTRGTHLRREGYTGKYTHILTLRRQMSPSSCLLWSYKKSKGFWEAAPEGITCVSATSETGDINGRNYTTPTAHSSKRSVGNKYLFSPDPSRAHLKRGHQVSLLISWALPPSPTIPPQMSFNTLPTNAHPFLSPVQYLHGSHFPDTL